MRFTTMTSLRKRHAILIESSMVDGEDHLPGAVKDVRSWQSFLTSNLGGAWDEGEISCLSMPTSESVARLIRLHSDGYVFIAFSGHGFERVNRDGTTTKMLCLNDREKSVPTDAISPKKFATAIFDCCRGLDFSILRAEVGMESYACAMDSAELANENFSQNSIIWQGRQACKKAFLSGLSRGEMSKTVNMFACSMNESANDNAEVGGYYTTLLIRGAMDWNLNLRQNRLSPIIYTTRDAHFYAKENMSDFGSSQHPEYTPLSVAYPFAVG